MQAFGLMDQWPVGWAAAVVVEADGTRHDCGPTDRPHRLASLTKPFTALAALVAVEEGIVSLDQPAGPPGCSLRHLLAHVGGLAPEQRRLLTEPGTRRIYSNAGYELVADLVAREAEMDFAEYLREAVAEPLDVEMRLDGSPAHGLAASANAVAELVWELLRPVPRLIASSTRTQMCSPVFGEVPGMLPGFGMFTPNPWGLGLEMRGHKDPHWMAPSHAPSTVGHFGRSGGFLWVDPVARLGCVVLTDTPFGPWTYECWPAFSAAVLADARLADSASTSAR